MTLKYIWRSFQPRLSFPRPFQESLACFRVARSPSNSWASCTSNYFVVVVVMPNPSGVSYMGGGRGQMSWRDEEFHQTLTVLEHICDVNRITEVMLGCWTHVNVCLFLVSHTSLYCRLICPLIYLNSCMSWHLYQMNNIMHIPLADGYKFLPSPGMKTNFVITRAGTLVLSVKGAGSWWDSHLDHIACMLA